MVPFSQAIAFCRGGQEVGQLGSGLITGGRAGEYRQGIQLIENGDMGRKKLVVADVNPPLFKVAAARRP